MQVSASENMCYLAEHIHYFEFHTPRARIFKQDLQGWWASVERLPSEAHWLQSSFLELCEADPAEACCGWFRRESIQMDMQNAASLEWAEEHLDISADSLPLCEISAKCMEAFFLPEQGCFFGLLSQDEQDGQRDLLLAIWQSRMRQKLHAAHERSIEHRDSLQERSFRAIYDWKDNFTEHKVLVLGAFTAVAVSLLPTWLSLLRAVAALLAASSFDWKLTNTMVMQMPESSGMPLLILAVLLVMEAAGLAAIPQTLWEGYFLGYRRLAMFALWVRSLRSRQHIHRLEERVETMERERYQWSASPKPVWHKLCFRMPGWVRIGPDPFDAECLKGQSIGQTLGHFPQGPRPGKRTRTISPGGEWVRMICCTCLAAVLLLDLPVILRPIIQLWLFG